MKKIEIHPLSALAGAGVAVLGMLALGAQSPGAVVPTHLKVPKVVEHVVKVKGVPAPEEMVRISGGTVFVVPQGKCLVVTGTGFQQLTAPSVSVLFDGQVAFSDNTHDEHTTQAIPAGLVAPAGTTVTVLPSGGPVGLAFGYLADA